MADNLRINISNIESKATGSIAHATDILIRLSNDIHAVTDIARQCRLSKSTVHRVLKLLEQSHLVVEDTINRRYYLGPLVTRLASTPVTTHKRLIMCAMDEMKRLSNLTEETVAMDIMVGIQYFSLHEISSRHDLRVTQETKKIGPLYAGLYAGATVKALLSQLEDEKLKIVLANIKIAPETERTVTDKELLMAQLKEIRQKGYSVTYGERIPGAICIAAPIKNYVLPLVICVVGPESRLQPRVKEVITEIMTSARRISTSCSGIFGHGHQHHLRRLGAD
jgi:DNA-binding IclR family transcriptional regulator